MGPKLNPLITSNVGIEDLRRNANILIFAHRIADYVVYFQLQCEEVNIEKINTDNECQLSERRTEYLRALLHVTECFMCSPHDRVVGMLAASKHSDKCEGKMT